MWKWRQCAPSSNLQLSPNSPKESDWHVPGQSCQSSQRKGPTGLNPMTFDRDKCEVLQLGWTQILAAVQATAELCRQNSTAKYIQYTWKPLPPPAQHLCIGALLGHSVSLISCVSLAVCPLPSSQKDGASLKCSHLSQKSQVNFLLFLSASTRCISYKCTRRPSALHSSPVHNYYFIVFLQTRLFSRMWLESVLEVRPFQSCNQQDWACS